MVENAYFCARIMSQWNKKELSILIPNYNNVSVELVTCLQKQAEALGIDYEIIVADDCSTIVSYHTRQLRALYRERTKYR